MELLRGILSKFSGLKMHDEKNWNVHSQNRNEFPQAWFFIDIMYIDFVSGLFYIFLPSVFTRVAVTEYNNDLAAKYLKIRRGFNPFYRQIIKRDKSSLWHITEILQCVARGESRSSLPLPGKARARRAQDIIYLRSWRLYH